MCDSLIVQTTINSISLEISQVDANFQWNMTLG